MDHMQYLGYGVHKQPNSLEIFLAFAVVITLSLVSFFVAKPLAACGILGICVFIDAICYLFITRNRKQSKYLPFLWWFRLF
jgi:membrane protein YdbS with pleckstrin-like domain